MRRIGTGLAILALAGCVLGTSAEVTTASGAAARHVYPDAVTPDSPIEHVVILYQENHTFDDVLGPVCQDRPTPCNGYIGPVVMTDGKTAENPPQPDQIPVVDHQPHSQKLGLLGKWDKIPGCTNPPYWCVSHVDPANMPNLTTLADRFTVSDATFAAGKAASFGAHVTLGAGTFDGFAGSNPTNSRRGAPPLYGWGCQSNKDMLWGAVGDRSYQPSCIPDQEGNGPYRKSKVPYTATIMERMEQAGLSWRFYEAGSDDEVPYVAPWTVCTYFAWCWLDRFTRQYDGARKDFIRDAGRGSLPNLSILIPTVSVSQHNLALMSVGDNYIGRIVRAVENGPDWDSTAIFITYDDCGCFYDHVTPPSDEYGMRNPMVIISPYAKAGGTDSNTAVQPYSMLSFTEHVFGLAPLTEEVSSAYDYAQSFDFNQTPLRGVPMTRQSVPVEERRAAARVAHLIEDDPT